MTSTQTDGLAAAAEPALVSDLHHTTLETAFLRLASQIPARMGDKDEWCPVFIMTVASLLMARHTLHLNAQTYQSTTQLRHLSGHVFGTCRVHLDRRDFLPFPSVERRLFEEVIGRNTYTFPALTRSLEDGCFHLARRDPDGAVATNCSAFDKPTVRASAELLSLAAQQAYTLIERYGLSEISLSLDGLEVDGQVLRGALRWHRPTARELRRELLLERARHLFERSGRSLPLDTYLSSSFKPDISLTQAVCCHDPSALRHRKQGAPRASQEVRP